MTDVMERNVPVVDRDFLRVNPLDRTHVFIDGSNLMGMLRSTNRKLDYKLFLTFLREQTRLIRANYFVILRDDSDKRATGVIDMIEYAGFEVYRKWGHEVQEQTGFFKFKGTIVPEMTVAILDGVGAGAEHVIIVSGDGDFYPAIEGAKNRGARVTLISHGDSTSDDVRRACDSFIKFEDLPEELFFSDQR